MASWAETEQAAPELAAIVKARFEAHGLGLLATVRRNGFPRISGIEPLFEDELWLGMMPNSRKATDLMSNPRMALHSATEDKNLANGDAKLSGEGILVEKKETIVRYLDAFEAHTGYRPPPGPMHLFKVDVKEMSFVKVAGDYLSIDAWEEGTRPRTIKRK